MRVGEMRVGKMRVGKMSLNQRYVMRCEREEISAVCYLRGM